MDPSAGMNIPNYKIGNPIGQGGMATVYLARHEFLERQVALKVISPEMAMDELHQSQLVKEGQTVATLDHPHIVKIYDVGKVDGQFYMAMEFLSGGSLQDKIKQGTLSPEEGISILEQIASALTYAHEKSLIHRDIKPSNIMFRDNGEAVLTDFGIAKEENTQGELTQMGYIVGSPSYMSPEQVMGERLDHRTDIYSLGVVFYEMLMGSRPFAGENTAAISYQHMNEPIPRLPKQFEFLQPVLDKVLAKKPQDRYSSVSAFVQTLKNAGSGNEKTIIIKPKQGSKSYSQRFLSTESKAASSNKSPLSKWLVPSAIFFVSLAVIGALLWMFNRDDEDGATTTEVVHAENKEVSSELENLLVIADSKWENSFYYDSRHWSSKCQQKLRESSTYSPEYSAEALYQQILVIDPANANARYRLQQIQQKADSFKIACEMDESTNQVLVSSDDAVTDKPNNESDDQQVEVVDENQGDEDGDEDISSNASEAQNIKGKWYFITAEPSLNIRNKPNKNAKKVGKLKFRKKLRILSNTVHKEKISGRFGYWVKIKSGNQTGYVYDRFIEPLQHGNARIFKRIAGQNYVVTGEPDLNLREGPSLGSRILDAVPKGEVVRVISNAGYPNKKGTAYWLKALYNNQEGYLYDRYLMPLVKYKDKVKRLRFPKKEGITVSGSIKKNRIETYVFRALATQDLQVSLEPSTNNNAILNIYGNDDRVLSYGETSTSVILPKTQDYFIAVINNTTSSLSYQLQITIPAL